MFFDFKGGIIAVARVILRGQGIYSPGYDLVHHIYDAYIADFMDYTQLVYHNIVTVLNNLLFRKFRKGAKFYSRWRALSYDLNLIPRRIFFQIYDEYSDMLEFTQYESRQFITATELLYGKIQDFLKGQSVTSSYNVFTGLIYDSDTDLTSSINSFLRTINFIEVIESVPTQRAIEESRRAKHSYWLKSTRKSVTRRKTSASIKMDTTKLRNQDRQSRKVSKSVLQYSRALSDLDTQIQGLLQQWDRDTRGFLKTKLKQKHKKARNQIIDLVMAELGMKPTDRSRKWRSIIQASYMDLQSYELLQKLDQYLQES